jgi:hypothetical protein
MTDWEIFTESKPWFLDDDAKVDLGPGREPAEIANGIQSAFPKLAELIRSATLTGVAINGLQHELLAWDAPCDNRIGWLCISPMDVVLNPVCSPHRHLLNSFGGVIERFNEPETRLLNHNAVLTNHEASFDASFINDYSWAFDGNVPIDLTAYYTVAREANGNTTICHRDDCSILLFAPDHAFKDVTTLDGCPDFTLYNIHNASTFTEWVELIAHQWLHQTTIVA